MPNILEKNKKTLTLGKRGMKRWGLEKGREGGLGKKEKKYLIFNEHE